MFAAHYQLDNLVAVVDNNGLQIDGRISDVMSPYPIDEKFKAFGWDVHEVDGHDLQALITTLQACKDTTSTKPQVVIAATIKGKGVSFMENQAGWHGKAPNDEQTTQALKEIDGGSVRG